MIFEIEDERAFTFGSLIRNETSVREIINKDNLIEIIKICQEEIEELTNYSIIFLQKINGKWYIN